MKRFFRPILFACTAAIAFAAQSHAATIVSVTGNDGTIGVPNGAVMTTSWTSTVGYTGVSITANLAGFGGGSTVVYLTTQVGPGTTVAQEVATVTISNSPVMTTVNLFSGLSLPSGTYYLTVENVDGFETMWQQGTATATGTGVTAESARYGGPPGSYAPAADTSTAAYVPIYSVTGTAVPEPATAGLTVAAFALLALRRRAG